ncbi:MAG: 1-acyl-sn-glycerol-3-phosphate acyltransferase [Planctomycetota bacterium]|nr:MAG: 1-acyl-sn-glycerol-3-phosphate acyltransferase [Planctomycetota bacterium]
MRKFWVYGFGVAWMVGLFVLFFPALFLWPTRAWRREVSRVYARWWSRGCLWAAGIRVRLEGAEYLGTRPAVFTFNHTSMIDFFVNATFAPPRCLVFGKKELVRVPFLGWMWFFGAHPLIERKNRDQWEVVLRRVENALRSGENSTLIAPEGTRSRDGRLLPFKKGAFAMAAKTGAPVVPVVLLDVLERYRAGRLRPGTVTVRVLPPIASDGWDPLDLDAAAKQVRAVYLRELGDSAA